MPVYNAAPFLADCLDSIIAQTHEHWELLAINDGSLDSSKTILLDYAQRDPRIKVLDNIGKGIVPALRLAYLHTKGDLITRMDADDIMKPNKIKALSAILLKNGTGHIATGLVQYFSAQTLGDGYKKYETWLNQLTKTASNYNEIFKECTIPSPCWMAFRADLERCGAFREDTVPEDYDLAFKFYENELSVIGVNEVLHLWRDHSTRTSRNHEDYANNQYLDLKTPYFIKLKKEASRPLILWGAGKKGKYIAKQLIESKTEFHWLTNNEAKLNVPIYDITLSHTDTIATYSNPQIIIAIAGPDDQVQIRQQLQEAQLSEGEHYWFFC